MVSDSGNNQSIIYANSFLIKSSTDDNLIANNGSDDNDTQRQMSLSTSNQLDRAVHPIT